MQGKPLGRTHLAISMLLTDAHEGALQGGYNASAGYAFIRAWVEHAYLAHAHFLFYALELAGA